MVKNYSIAIVRTPHIQIYEGLTELLGLVARMSDHLDIISTVSGSESEPLWKPSKVNYFFVEPKNTKLVIPTTIKLALCAITKSFKYKPYLVIGGDAIGNIIAAFIHKLLGIPFVYYGLELPCLKQPNMSWADKLEHWSIRSADLVVTMDEHHANFIRTQAGINKNRFAYLPVASSGPLNNRKNNLLRKRFSLQENDLLLLHAGGIGAAQQSLELANTAKEWAKHYNLVFHAHCRMDDDYFQKFAHMLHKTKNVHLNNEPVNSEELDVLVSSADIGIAWYDHDLLGYRAELLGVAAGKIGRYLKNGLPVICRNLPTVKEYLDKYECGLCTDKLEDIPAAIDIIENNYERYSKNALRCYEELWRPDRYLIEIQRRIENILN